MTKIEKDLEVARYAGRTQNKAIFTRLIIESKVNRQLLSEAYAIGSKQMDSGMFSK